MSEDGDSRALNAAVLIGAAALLVLAIAAAAIAVGAAATAFRSDEVVTGSVGFVIGLGLMAGVVVLVVALAIVLVGGALHVFDGALRKPWEAVAKEENKPTVVVALLALLAGGFVYGARQVGKEWSPVWSFTLTVVPLLIAAVSAALVSVSVRVADSDRMDWLDRAVLGVKFLGVLIPLIVVVVGAFALDWLAGFRSLNTSEQVLLILSGAAYASGVMLLVILLRRQRKSDVARSRAS